jgi:hypothetical protein
MKQNNSIDQYIEQLHEAFGKIPYFEVLQKSDIAKDIFDSLTNKMLEVSNLRSLYQDYYCSAAIECIKHQRNVITKSKYVSVTIDIENELQDIYYLTIRNGYVHLFHSVESFMRLLFDKVNTVCIKENNRPIEKYCFENYNFNIGKHWRRTNQTVEKINWITNRVKHYDGFPSNEINQLPIHYLLLSKFAFDEKVRIKIEIDELVKDINEILDFFITISFIIAKLYVLQLCESLVKSLNNQEEIPLDVRDKINIFQNSYSALHNEILKIIELWKYIGIDEK